VWSFAVLADEPEDDVRDAGQLRSLDKDSDPEFTEDSIPEFIQQRPEPEAMTAPEL